MVSRDSGARSSPCEGPAAASVLMEVSPVEKALILLLLADAEDKQKAANKKAKAGSGPVGPAAPSGGGSSALPSSPKSLGGRFGQERATPLKSKGCSPLPAVPVAPSGALPPGQS